MATTEATEKLSSQAKKKQRIVRLLANSVGTNLSTEIKTNGVENVLTLDPWATAEAFFEVEHSQSFLTVFIDLSCFAALQWKVSLLELGDVERMWRTVEIDKPHGQTGPKAFLQVRNYHANGLSVALATYETKDSQVFTLESAPKGFYKIDMRSTSKQKQVVKMSVQVGRKLNPNFPLLPADNQLTTAQIANELFNFYWQPVELNGSTRREEIQYCFLINTDQYLNHLCEVGNVLRRSPHSVIDFSCFGGPHKYHLRHALSPDQKYYVNLFAVNLASNRSRPYRGLTLPKARNSLMSRLTLDLSLNLKINKKTSYHVIYFDVKKSGVIRLTYVACEGPVSVFVAKDGKVFRRFGLGNIKTHVLKTATIGRYFVTVTKKFIGSLQLRVHLSSGKRWGPFPRLPKGISVKEWPMLRTCNSITVAWIAGHGRQQFCLFIGRESARAVKQLRNMCYKPASDPGIRLITCLDKRIRKSENTVFWRTIKGLQECTDYIFYIQVKRRRADDTLLYKPLKVRTRCNRCNIYS